MKRKGKAWHLGIQRMLQRAASYKNKDYETNFFEKRVENDALANQCNQ